MSVIQSARRRLPAVLLVVCAALMLAGTRPAEAQSFRAAPQMPTHIHPNSIAFADFNGDSLLDMAVPQYEWGLTIFLGNGSGGFTEAATYQCGTPRASIARDLNGDGRIDIIVSDERGRVWVFIGAGTGAFAAGVSYVAGDVPYFASAADFNEDGKTDVATANSGGGTVSILLGDGLGHFGAQTEYPVGANPRSVVPGDFNSDGHVDLAVANFDSNTVSLMLGNGAGGFGAAFDVASAAGPYLIATGDLNGDGRADLVVPNFNGGSVSTFFGDGAAHFTLGATYATADSPRHAAIADLNADGRPDLVVANRYASSISVLIGTGGGAFAAPRTYGVGAGPFFTAVADLNRDGRVDLAVINRDGFTISVLPGDGTGTYAAATPLPVGTGPRGIAAADFDGDGRLDLALPNYYNNNVSILAGAGTGGASPAGVFAVNRSPWAAVTADFNGDGAPDVAVTASGQNSVSVLKNTGAFSFAAVRNFAAAQGPIALAAVDLNRDNKIDLVTANASGGSISVLPGDGAGGFGAPVNRTVGTTPNGIATADFNGDGNADLAVSNGDSASVSVLLGDGAGGFLSTVAVPTQTKPSAVVAGDFNGDLVTDLAVSSSAGNNVRILLGNGLGGFAAGQLVAVGTTPLGIAAADLDGDGVLDLVTANAGANTVSVLRGAGNGTFGPAAAYGAGLYPRNIVLADFDGDGRKDIAVANANSNDAWILINTTGHGDLSASITDGLTEVSPGQRVRYTLTALNAGPSDVGGAIVSALFPAGVTDVQWTCVASSGSSCGASGSGALADSTWLRVNGVVTYTVDATLPADATGTLQVHGSVTMPPGDDPNPANNDAVDVDAVISNHAPVAQDGNSTTAEDTGVSIAALATDAESDPLTWHIVAGPQHGALTGTLPNVTYTPVANFNGTDAFTFQVNDGRADSNIGTVHLTVTPANDAPIANAQSVSTQQDTPLAITLTASDVDADVLTYSIVTPPAHGSLSGTGAALTYTPSAGYHGPDSFTFQASDGSLSASATVSITVTKTNHAPTLAAPIADVSVNTDATVTFVDLTSTFADSDIVDGDTLTLSVAANSNAALVTPTITGTSLRLGLAAGVSGTSTVRIRATDSHGLFVEDEFVVSVARPPLNVSIADASVAEGNSGTRSLIFTLTLSGSAVTPVTVNFTTADATAAAGSDYTAGAGTITFNPGVTSRTITLLVSGDVVDEADETLLVRLTGASGAVISRDEAVGTIVDDDLSKISIADLTVTEGNDGSAVATFQVTMSNPNSRDVTVDYATGNSTAVAGLDFTAASGTLTFPAGVQTLTISVPVAGDTMDEANEKFTVGLSNVTNATIQRAVGTATILDDDAPPTVSIEDVTVVEGNSGSPVASFVVRLSAPSGLTTRVQFATSDGTAQAGADYRAGTGTVTFAPGATTGQVNVVLITNRIAEPTETFVVTLSAPTLLTIDRAQATGTILDDDGS